MTTSRPYSGDADRERIRAFLIAATAADSGHYRHWHVGDLIWRMYKSMSFDPYTCLRLWEDTDGELVGVVSFEEPGAFEMQIHRYLRGDGALARQMIDWASEGAQRQTGAVGGSLRTKASVEDQATTALLTSEGFARDSQTPASLQARWGFPPDDFHDVLLRRDLRQPLSAPVLPDGWTARHVGGEDEWEARVLLHREVWQPSQMTLEAYRRLRGIPGYDPTLDLVAVAPNGDFASYCICWLDSANQVGLFEPVGTGKAYRGQRIGQAVMLEGLGRLHALGAHTALVRTVGVNHAAIRLYGSVGFEVVDREYYYVKALG